MKRSGFMGSLRFLRKELTGSSARKAVQGLAVAIGMFLISLPLFSQANAGLILGTITDQTGGVVAGAMVTITDTQRGVSRVLSADTSGAYLAPNLTPGTYTLRAEFKGFKATERQNILLEVGQEVRVDLTLQPGEQSERITVTESLPLVETTSATLGGTLTNQTINDLPLNGRNFTNLLQLRPGVVVLPGGGAWAQSSNGVRPESNVYIVDGLLGMDNFSGQSAVNSAPVGGDAATILPIDSIQEFKTEQNPPAEFGWKPGAIVNLGLKSGTNTIHGTAYAFGRTGAWDARNFFNTPPNPKTQTQLEQFGGTLGGAIIKDKLFYFVGGEGQLYSVGSTYTDDAPFTCAGGSAGCAALPTNDPSLSLLDACNALKGGPQPMSSLSLSLVGLNSSCVPQSNYPGVFVTNNGQFATPDDPNKFYPNLQTTSTERGGVAKVDYHPSDHHEFRAFYFFGQFDATFNQDPIELKPIWQSLLHTRSQMFGTNWTWIPNSSWVNEFRVGVARMYQPTYSVDHNVNPTSYGINTGVTNPLLFGFPTLTFQGFSNYFLGRAWPKIQGPDNEVELADSVSRLYGRHAFKFGGALILSSFQGAAFQNAKGRFNFRGAPFALENFLLGKPANGQLLVGDPIRQLSNQGIAAFVQDSWRVTPRVTANLGLRYEINTVVKEAKNRLGSFDPARGLAQVGAGISSPYNGDHNNFAPRVGIAWDVRGDGKTVIRAGGSMLYEQLSYNTFMALGNLLGIGIVPTGAVIGCSGTLITPAPSTGSNCNGQLLTPGGNIASGSITFPSSFTSPRWNASSVGGQAIFPQGNLNCNPDISIDGISGSPCNVLYVDRNLRTPYVSTWMLDVQRAITSNMSLDIAYVGDHGTKLVGLVDRNQALTGGGSLPFSTQFPYLAYIYNLYNRDRSNYNALQLTLTGRNYRGLSFLTGYTYAHALDAASRNWEGGVATNSYNPQLQYGNADFDVRHRLTFSATYVFPSRKSFAQLLQGWRVNSIVTLQTGLPWGAVDLSNNFSGTGENDGVGYVGERWNFYGNPKDFQSNANPIPYYSGPDFPAACTKVAPDPATLAAAGCYVRGSSVLVPPTANTFGTAGRNIFPSAPFRNWDLSLSKDWKFRERLTAQFRAETFNIFNHPILASPNERQASFNDASSPGTFGCGCITPDQATQNPVLGSGGPRRVQLGLKLIF